MRLHSWRVHVTCAILASSCSFFSLLSLCAMKSLSMVLWPCMLYSLLVSSIPLCSSFTSRRTFSSETGDTGRFMSPTGTPTLATPNLWTQQMRNSKWEKMLGSHTCSVEIPWTDVCGTHLLRLSPHSAVHCKRAKPACISPSPRWRCSATVLAFGLWTWCQAAGKTGTNKWCKKIVAGFKTPEDSVSFFFLFYQV